MVENWSIYTQDLLNLLLFSVDFDSLLSTKEGFVMADLIWLTNEQMRRISPYFPKPHGIPRVDERKTISRIVFVIKNGARWRDVPKEHGHHKTIYNRFMRWSKLGIFKKILAALAEKTGKPDKIMMDATHLWERPPPYHGFDPMMTTALPRAKVLPADRADAKWLREALIAKGITPCIPSRKNRKTGISHDVGLYKKRHIIETMFAKLKDWRRIAMRYDRCAHTFFSAICIAATILFWINQWVLSIIDFPQINKGLT